MYIYFFLLCIGVLYCTVLFSLRKKKNYTIVYCVVAVCSKGRVPDIIIPPRACAARVTVFGLCVCLSVCLFTLYSLYPVYSCAFCLFIACIQVLHHPPAHLPFVFTCIRAYSAKYSDRSLSLSLCIASCILFYSRLFRH